MKWKWIKWNNENNEKKIIIMNKIIMKDNEIIIMNIMNNEYNENDNEK